MSFNTDYLRFDTASMQKLITEKLLENSTYTDQIYPGSNLSIFIDIFAAMFGCLTYELNLNATESLHSDAQFYASMNRIVKMLGYNPHGIITSYTLCTVDLKDSIKDTSTTAVNDNQLNFPRGIITLPKYTTLTLQTQDNKGRPLMFSTVDNFSLLSVGKISSETIDLTDRVIDADNKPLFYNGEWTYLTQNIITAGIPYESFLLSNIPSENIVAYPHIHVYAEDIATGQFIPYSHVVSLNNSSPVENHFEVRINENKQYTIKFGDGVHGKRLRPNQRLHVIYLRANDSDSEIAPNTIAEDKDVVASVHIRGLSELFIRENILKTKIHSEFITFGSDVQGDNLSKLSFTNETPSSNVKDFESVDSMRDNAPISFKMGNRVITQEDFEYYIKSNYNNTVLDINVMNNYEYMVTFQKWLSDFNVLDIDVRYFDYEFADACDFNNVYLWMRSRKMPQADVGNRKYFVDNETLKIMEKDLQRIKPLTSEVIFPKPIETLFTPCIYDNVYDIYNWDTKHENKIVIFRDRNTLVTSASIKQSCINIIKRFFDPANVKMGQTVDPSELYNMLNAITGVKEVKTRYWPDADRLENKTSTQEWYDGLSFAKFTPFLISGQDVGIISGPYKLLDFQFPTLMDADYITNKIEIVSDKYTLTSIEY